MGVRNSLGLPYPQSSAIRRREDKMAETMLYGDVSRRSKFYIAVYRGAPPAPKPGEASYAHEAYWTVPGRQVVPGVGDTLTVTEANFLPQNYRFEKTGQGAEVVITQVGAEGDRSWVCPHEQKETRGQEIFCWICGEKIS